MKLFKKHKIGIDFILLEIYDEVSCGGCDLWIEVIQGNDTCKTIQQKILKIQTGQLAYM